MSDKPIVYEQDGIVYYRASSLGGCIRALVLARQGYEPAPTPGYALEMFQGGHEAEAAYFESIGGAENPQHEIQLWLSETIVVMGHLDNWLSTVPTVIEVKSQGDEPFKKWDPGWFETDPLWMKYTWQMSVYMHATNAEYFRLIRVLRSDHTKVESWGFAMPDTPPWFKSFEDIKARVDLVEMLAQGDVMGMACTHDDWVCPFYYTHPEPEVVEDPGLEALTSEYIGVNDQEKKLKDHKSRLRKEIEEKLGGRTKVRLSNGVNVSWSEYETKERITPAGKATRLTVKEAKNVPSSDT